MKYLIILLSLTALPMMAANTLTGTVKDSNSANLYPEQTLYGSILRVEPVLI